MPAAETSHSAEDVSRIGVELFARQVRPALGPGDDGKFVALDIGTADYELDKDDYAAVTRLRARRPSAEIWLGRIGQPAAYRMRGSR